MSAMRVKDLMSDKVLAALPGDSVEVLFNLMEDHRIRHVPVVDEDGDLVGLVTHRDLLRGAVVEQPDLPRYVERAVRQRLRVRDLMVAEPLSVGPDTDLREAAQVLLDNKFGCLPVVEGSRLVGILTEADFVRLMASGH